ncbi:general secretion pathway protein GspD [Adhaeretor mobilis]|uniref:Outer membrane porin HofQ n=1 Tax=Adhaeretor mobilis TaxID=1930276 RepID=A0A517MSZ6_9BACT|nr:general secretion pathway protein GspD [Adhaeretor mobilis]QDS97998.1 outer membrane porin HofQ [Adhaeretor mobilis]
MKRTSKIFAASVLTATALVHGSLSYAEAAAQAETPASSAGESAPPSRYAKPTAPTDRTQLDAMVSEARSALQAGRLEEADRLLTVAEQSEVRYPKLHFGDTPQRVRLDWLKSKKAESGAAGSRPSFNPLAMLGRGPAELKNDPFLGAGTAAGSSNSASPIDAPAATSREVGSRDVSDQALLTARQALSVGDLPRAEEYLSRAQLQQVAYQADEDSPERVAASIEECRRIAEVRQSDPRGDAWRHAYAKYLVVQAESLTYWGDLETASRTASEAAELSDRFASNEITPQEVLQQIAEIRQQEQQQAVASNTIEDSRIVPAGLELPIPVADDSIPQSSNKNANRAEIRLAQSTISQLPAVELPSDDYDNGQPLITAPQSVGSEGEVLPLPKPGPDNPQELLKQGEELLRSGQRAAALESFRTAYQQKDSLDIISQQRLQGHLQMLSVAPAEKRELPSRSANTGMLESAGAGQSVLARQVWSDVSKKQTEATRIRELDPNRSLELLQEATKLVSDSGLDEVTQRRLLSSVTTNLEATERYIKDNQSEIDLASANQAVLDENDRRSKLKVEVGERIAEMVDQFNKLVDEQRYSEAEVVANKLHEMAPKELVAKQIWRQAKTIRRDQLNQDIIAQSENGVANAFLDIKGTSAQALEDSMRDYGYGANWKDIADRKSASDRASRRNARELEIEQKLKSDVSVSYNETPLSSVIDGLSELAGINIYLDPLGLSQEGVRSDTPVTIDLKRQVSLKSALQLILEPLHLTYAVKDEVLKITSEQIRDGDVQIETYNVADLVVPIPNFVPSTNMGLQGLINDAYAATAMNSNLGGTPGPMSAIVNDGTTTRGSGVMSTNQLGQQFGAGNTGSVTSGGGGPPLGGAANADFDSLIDLILSTVEHDSWMENGTGEGEIRPFPTNLSLVVSQTQRVHEQIRDLLEQLRRQQDLQVTIEVRFIRLQDSFFERIGMDFDLNIEDNIPFVPQVEGTPPNQSYASGQPSITAGLTGPTEGNTGPLFNVALDTEFRQGSFTLSNPQFGTPSDFATFGFAILSDIEAYFFITAAQGDRRSNQLNAPKVTLFNGQQAVVVDTAFVPFVISVIPVVGEFAAAQQPVIVVLSEGTMMTVQAVVSDDRRYVRLTLVPFFSQIGNVQTFTFDGSETTSSSSMSTDDDGDGNDESNDDAQTTVRSGTTVQLPTFQVISVSTTVSVPDGGTVLLGGIKRLREGRNEFGVPLLSKVPYLDRLFRNVGIGRETDSLMMMVTPHIIIQEEEEERLGLRN